MIRLLMITSVLLSACQFGGVSDPIVERLPENKISTSVGIVQGQLSVDQAAGSAAGVVSWLDIPYAQPPVADLRWKATRELSSPERIIDRREDTACVQKASRYAGASGEGIVGSEDCLYLDVRAPADFASKQYPVMFWIHGGANTTGLKDYYDFTALVASQDVVVVTINYRLGALGWFTHPAIQGLQEGIDKTSNFGTLDIIESLKWVQKNIKKFGGDANNVTIFGESAGGHNVFALLVSPLTNGLFHKAISQSGYTTSAPQESAYNLNAVDPLIKRGSWQIVNKILDNPQSDYSVDELRQSLREIDAREFVGLYYTESLSYDEIPLTTIDGVVIPREGMEAALGMTKYAKNVPVIAGATKDEVSLWLGLHRYFLNTSYILTKLLPPKITLKNPELFEFWVRTRSHAWKLRGVDEPLVAMESAGYDDLYAYSFDWDHQDKSFFIDFPNIIGAAHGTDIAFLTGVFSYGPISSYIYPQGTARSQMRTTMMGAWSNFARSADPGVGLPFDWVAFKTAKPAFIHLDKDDLLRMDVEQDNIVTLLKDVSEDSDSTELEKCFIVWEAFTAVGDNRLAEYHSWNNGLCNQFDIKAEQRKMNDSLIAEFGSAEVI
jgi:para-nitrobenzyl esterase